ncbi:MAG: hypothetical protein FWD79_11575 [Desulfobulbus sp.]|nr:hypothetical protein [Desulfobulbus sp.]
MAEITWVTGNSRQIFHYDAPEDSKIFWHATCQSGYMDGYCGADSMEEAVSKAHAFALNVMGGEGELFYYDSIPRHHGDRMSLFPIHQDFFFDGNLVSSEEYIKRKIEKYDSNLTVQ